MLTRIRRFTTIKDHKLYLCIQWPDPTQDDHQPEVFRAYHLCLNPWKPAGTRDNQLYLTSQRSANIRDYQLYLQPQGPATMRDYHQGLPTLGTTRQLKTSIIIKSTKARTIW